MEITLSLPILKPEDGNLIILDNFQLDSLLQNSDLIWEGRNVKVLSTKDKVPDLNIRVAIKEITSECEGDGNNPLSIANEMIASRVKHFAIAPFIAYFEKELQDGRRSFYLMSPFFENGNLLDCIRRDRNSKPQDIKLDKDKRKKILYHIASGIDYLHTKETGYRGTVLHVDLTSNNVVLDKYWNARLIDFGLACELNEKQTAKSVTTRYGKEGYIYTKKDSKLRVYDDYHNFGVGKFFPVFTAQ